MKNWKIVVVLLSGLAGCGSPSLTCQTQSCDNGKTYKACAKVDGSVSYSFGGMSCSCSSSNQTACQTCAAKIAAYCGGGSSFDFAVGSGNMDAGGQTACAATFSGGTSGTSTCAVTINYQPAQGQWVVSTAGNTVSGTSYTWTGFSFVLTGTPTTGTWDQTSAYGATSQVAGSGNVVPDWIASSSMGTTVGSASLTLTELGASSTITGSGGQQDVLYQAPHGTWTGTLLDQDPQTNMAPVMLTVTF